MEERTTFRRAEWPEVGDLVIATVKTITDYGAYVTLDEYEKEGLLHISEVSSSWVRNIRSFVREGQKVVLKVLRVNVEKKQVDLSLRRVTRSEKREKILTWKRERRAEILMRSASEKLHVPFEELYEKTGMLMEKEFGGIYDGLEKAAREGGDALSKVGVPQDVAAVLEEIAKEKIRMPLVKVRGILELSCPKPNGVTHIREALLSAQKIKEPAKVHVYVVAPPKYRIEVLAEDYKEAERVLEKATEVAVKNITKAGGHGAFKREK